LIRLVLHLVVVKWFVAPKDHGAGKCRDACLGSIQHLGVTYLDMFLIHWPGVQGMKPEDCRQSELRQQSWRDLEQLYDEGKHNQHRFLMI